MAANVLFLVVDTLRADAVFGDRVDTPAFDSLAARGSAFTQCISTCTSTTPSFSSMFTGLYPPKHGVRGLKGYALPSSVKTMAELFADAGYHTAAEVTGPLLPETGVLRGFKEAHHRSARLPFFAWRDEVLERLRSRPSPWFTTLHLWEAHRPYRPPPTFEPRHDAAGYEASVAAIDEGLRPIFDEMEDGLIVLTGDHGEQHAPGFVSRTVLRVIRRLRRQAKLASVSAPLDSKLATWEIGHGFTLSEDEIRVPLIISGPGVPVRLVDDQVKHVDLLPTIADLCGLADVSHSDGTSLRRVMEGAAIDEPAYLEAVGVQLEEKRLVGARRPPWKYVRRPNGNAALYNVAEGNGSQGKDVSRRFPEVVKELASFVDEIAAATVPTGGADLSQEEEAIVEKHLRDLGYL